MSVNNFIVNMLCLKMWNVRETSSENVSKEIKMNSFKKVVLIVKVIVFLLAQRRFENLSYIHKI